MKISIFKDITTDEYIKGVVDEAKKYEGLYVDMNNAPERKYVKENAAEINYLLKVIDRARIDKSKEYKKLVEHEAAKIKKILDIANIPFTLLINEYTAERAKILAEEKRVKELKEFLIQLVEDHEQALTLNKIFDFEKAEQEREQIKRDEELKELGRKQAAEQAKQDAINAKNDRIAYEKQVEQDKINAERKRLADIKQAKQDAIFKQNELIRIEKEAESERAANREYTAKINNNILAVLLDIGISEADGKKVIKIIVKGLLPNTVINY